MNIIQPVLDELNAIIATALALPATSPNLREVRAARLNWRSLIEEYQQNGSGGINPPYVVVQLGPLVPDEDYAPMEGEFYRLPVSVYYIDGPSVPIETIETKLQALSAALKPETTYTNFMFTDEGVIDCSDGNPANQAFLEQNARLLAGLWAGMLLVSE